MKIDLTRRPSLLRTLMLCLAANLFISPAFFHSVTAHAADEEWDRHVKERLDSPERRAFIEGAAQRDAQVMEQRRAERAAEEKRKEQSEQREQQHPDNGELTVELNGSKPEGYTLEAESRPRPDATADVTVTVKRNGKTVGKGVTVRFEAAPAYPNLSNRVRHTDAAGQVALKGLIRRTDAGQLKALVGGQKTAVSIPVATDAAHQTTTVAAPAPADSPEEYFLEAQFRLRPDATANVTVTVKKNGRPVGKGVAVRFEADPAYPNLSNRVRHTDAAGQIALKGLIRRTNAGQLKALVGGQKTVVSVPDATAATARTTAVAVPAPEPEGQSDTSEMADAGQAPAYDVYSIAARGKIMAAAGHDVLFIITKNGRPAADVTIRFEQNPAYANLPAGYLRTDAQGHVEVKQLTASPGASDLRVEVAGQEPVICRMTVLE